MIGVRNLEQMIPILKSSGQVRIEGNVCHAEDPDEVRTLSVEPQCLSELLGQTLDSASYIRFLKTKFPGMIRIFESRTLLGKTTCRK